VVSFPFLSGDDMPRFSGEYDEQFEVGLPVDKVKAHFGDLDTIVANYGPLQAHRKLDPETLELTLIPRAEKGVSFAGKYSCKYTWPSENVLKWETVGTGNMWSNGRAEFSAVGDSRTRVSYSQRMETEMQVNSLLAKVIRPIVNTEIKKGVREYLGRMRSSLKA
jgi:carbon monoxide dehydrogenase subunit G